MTATEKKYLDADAAEPLIIARRKVRELPCKLTDEEWNTLARQRVAEEAELAKLKAELAAETSRRKAEIENLADTVARHGVELYTGNQDRTVYCDELLMRGIDPRTGAERFEVHTRRRDTGELFESRPASINETQRSLPGTESSHAGGLLEEARAKQGSAEIVDADPFGSGEHDAKSLSKRGRGRRAKDAGEPSDVPGEEA